MLMPWKEGSSSTALPTAVEVAEALANVGSIGSESLARVQQRESIGREEPSSVPGEEHRSSKPAPESIGKEAPRRSTSLGEGQQQPHWHEGELLMREERCSRLILSEGEERLVPGPSSFEEGERDAHSLTTFGEGERWKRPIPSEEEGRLQRQRLSEEGERLPRLERPTIAEEELLNCRPRRCEEEGRRPSGRVQQEAR